MLHLSTLLHLPLSLPFAHPLPPIILHTCIPYAPLLITFLTSPSLHSPPSTPLPLTPSSYFRTFSFILLWMLPTRICSIYYWQYSLYTPLTVLQFFLNLINSHIFWTNGTCEIRAINWEKLHFSLKICPHISFGKWKLKDLIAFNSFVSIFYFCNIQQNIFKTSKHSILNYKYYGCLYYGSVIISLF